MRLKSEFRKKALLKLRTIPKNRRLLFSRKVSNSLEKILLLEKPKSILFYLPLEIEPDILLLLKKFRKRNIKIFVPFIDSITFKMVKFRLPLKKSQFGTLESGNSKRKIDRVDIVIAPTIGIDMSFRRIGFGKGMYDRFYESLKKRPKLIFVQNISCISREEITEKHDIRADYYITQNLSLKIKDQK